MTNILVSESCDLSAQGVGCLRTGVTTALALSAFAANSIICRTALGSNAIDPAGFTAIRLISGALALLAVTGMIRKPRGRSRPGSWVSAFLLFCYAVAFSFAYINLPVSVGALILFGSVQASMITIGLFSGERPHYLVWAGIATALFGLIFLVLPGLTAPPPAGAALMVAAGTSWGIYSMRGKGTQNPVAVTGDNFLRAAPLALLAGLVMFPHLHITYRGALLAVISGALTSGLGYVIWFAALRNLTATRAASVQLLVPVIAATGGVLFLSEQVTLRLVIASGLIIGGVAATIAFKDRKAATRSATP